MKTQKDITALIEKTFPTLKPHAKELLLRTLQKYKKEKKMKNDELLAHFNNDKGMFELRKMKRQSEAPGIGDCISRKFQRDVIKLLGMDESLYNDSEKELIPNYTIDEQINVVETIIEIGKMKLENVDAEKIEEKYIELLKKYREKLRINENINILNYFSNFCIIFQVVGNDELDYYTKDEFYNIPDPKNKDTHSGEESLSELEFRKFLRDVNYSLNGLLRFLLVQPAMVQPKGKQNSTSVVTISLGEIPSDKVVKISIDTVIRENVWKSLAEKYFPKKEDHELLKNVLDGLHVDRRIVFKGYASQLVWLFYHLKQNNKITNDKTDIAKWICNYFEYLNKQKENKKFDYNNVYNDLTNPNFKIPKNRRIIVLELPANAQ